MEPSRISLLMVHLLLPVIQEFDSGLVLLLRVSPGPRPLVVFSHVDTLDVDNEDFLTVLQSHCLFYYRIISCALCRFT